MLCLCIIQSYFPENAASVRTERPIVPIKTVAKAYTQISLKIKKKDLRQLQFNLYQV